MGPHGICVLDIGVILGPSAYLLPAAGAEAQEIDS